MSEGARLTLRAHGPPTMSPQAGLLPSTLGLPGPMLPGAALDRQASHKPGDRAGSTGVPGGEGEHRAGPKCTARGFSERSHLASPAGHAGVASACPKCAGMKDAGWGQHPHAAFISNGIRPQPRPSGMTWALPPERRFRGGGDSGTLAVTLASLVAPRRYLPSPLPWGLPPAGLARAPAAPQSQEL